MSDFTLTLGDFVFADVEVPERLAAGGGEQRLNIHELVGDARTIDTMGLSRRPIEWSGRFRGGDAVSRAQDLDAIFAAGLPVPLTYGDFSYTVVIQHYAPDMDGNEFEVPYSITCIVQSATDAAAPQSPGVDEMIDSDHSAIQTLGATFGDAQLGGFLGDLNSAVGQVTSFASAARSTVATVLAPLTNVQMRVGDMISSAEATLGEVTSLGGVFPLGRPAAMAQSLLGQAQAMTQCADLYDLHNLCGRMATNLAAIGSGGAVITTAGADLFALAAKYYGDATEWATIARANGVTEPLLTGLRSLLIPPSSGKTGGVLSEVSAADQTLIGA